MSLALFFLFSTYFPIEDWTNRVFDELRVRGLATPKFTHVMPYERRLLENLRTDTLPERTKILVERLLSQKKNYYGKVSFSSDTLFGCFQHLGGTKDFSKVGLALELIGKFGKSPQFPPLAWDTLYGIEYRRGYLSLKFSGLEFLIGRNPIRWGPYPLPSLLISGNSPPFNLFFASGEYKNLKGSFLFTPLDPYTLDTSRFLSAHRLDWALFNGRLILGFSEAVLFCRSELSQGISYLNPISLYRLSEYNYHYGNERLGIPSFNDDLYWDFDFAYYFKNKCLYGELLLDDIGFIDDIHYPGIIRDLKESGPLGFIFGIKAADLLIPNSYQILQYTRVNSSTYFHYLRKNYYLYLGYPIGHPYGPDFDEVNYQFLFHFNPSFDFYFGLSLLRHGRTRLAFNAEVPPRNSFLWVKEGEKPQNNLSLLFGGDLFSPRWVGKLEIGWTGIRNYGLTPGKRKIFLTTFLAVKICL